VGSHKQRMLGYPLNYTQVNKCQQPCNSWNGGRSIQGTSSKESLPLCISLLQNRIHPSSTQAGSTLHIGHSHPRLNRRNN